MKIIRRLLLALWLGLWALAAGAESQPLAELVSYPTLSAPATVLAKHDTPLAVEEAGVVTQLMAEVGDQVTAGQLLLAIDPFPLQQQLTQQQALLDGLGARIELAQFQLQQAQRLAKQSNVSEELLRTRQAELASLQADHQRQQAEQALLQHRLHKSQLRAPFAGVISARSAQLGGYLAVGAAAFQLLATDAPQLRVDFAAEHRPSWDENSVFEFVQGERRYPVALVSIVPMLDPIQRSQQARFRFVDQAPLLGSSGRLWWTDRRPHLAARYLLRREGQLGLYLMQQGRAQFVPLPGAQEGRSVVIEQLPLQQQLLLDGDRPQQP